MKKRRPRKHPRGNLVPAKKTAKTGEHCPTTGYWLESGGLTDKRFILQGSVMPANKGQSATWTLLDSEDTFS